MYQVDVWSGELHQTHSDCREFEEWQQASDFMEPLIEAGFLCNVLHTDYKAPAHRVDEVKQALAKELK